MGVIGKAGKGTSCICGCSVRSSLHMALLAPGILGWLPHLWTVLCALGVRWPFCAPLARKYEGCPESIQPFSISREPVVWPRCNLAASQRRPYCSSVNRHSPLGLDSRQWDTVDRTLCTVWQSHLQWPSEQISFITTMRLPILQLSCRLFWQSITSPRSVSPPTVQIWLPATSGFSLS